ncbi:hypothetical protein CYMTET_46899 [Cymbomonas tetramitiformis]|uniref:tRNA-specific adenosine deaminase 1 n=1 Tax=Cymbomonas tetramitiformis TaxID=36881 RepID=A0AAE0BV98_9CHLO|nr:hypothetical protein CYMTET_46899 [Cymbomonas tetramitiformis]
MLPNLHSRKRSRDDPRESAMRGDSFLQGDMGHAISAVVLEKYADLPKTGKPQANEYTLLAGFVLADGPLAAGEPSNLQVVALGTGTKCLGAAQRSSHGDLVNDCHAEIVARRALLAYLHSEIALLSEEEGGASQIFERVPAAKGRPQRFRMREGIGLHMYTTQPPCGDASVFELDAGASPISAAEACSCAPPAEDAPGPTSSGAGDVATGGAPDVSVTGADGQNRTGAKLVDSSPWTETGRAQARGMARRKPGRGDPTLSMSCSDKLAKWSVLGIQGTLLSSLLAQPLYLDTLTVAQHPGGARALSAVRRAIGGRLTGAGLEGRLEETGGRFCLRPAEVLEGFPAPYQLSSAAATSSSACGFAVVWHAGGGGPSGTHEVVMGARGRKQGTSKKGALSTKTRSAIAPASLLLSFQHLASSIPDLHEGGMDRKPYQELKESATEYRSARTALLAPPSWSIRPRSVRQFDILHVTSQQILLSNLVGFILIELTKKGKEKDVGIFCDHPLASVSKIARCG